MTGAANRSGIKAKLFDQIFQIFIPSWNRIYSSDEIIET